MDTDRIRHTIHDLRTPTPPPPAGYAHVLGEGQNIAAIKHLDAQRPVHTE